MSSDIVSELKALQVLPEMECVEDFHDAHARKLYGRAADRIEALERDVVRLKGGMDEANQAYATRYAEWQRQFARAERLRVAITTAIANMDHDYAYEVLCKAVAEECSVSPVKYTGGMNDLCVSAVGDDVRASELLRKALASVDRHMTDAIICLAAGGAKGSATNILNRAVDIARTALQDNKQ